MIDLPPDVARSFVEDARAYFAEPNAIKRDFIAGRQLQALHTPRVTERSCASPTSSRCLWK
jgi:hypothetical protein